MVNCITCENSIMLGLGNCYITAAAVIIRQNLAMNSTFNIEEETARRKTKGAGATISSHKVSSSEATYSAVNTGYWFQPGVQLQIAANNHISIHMNSSYIYPPVASYSCQ